MTAYGLRTAWWAAMVGLVSGACPAGDDDPTAVADSADLAKVVVADVVESDKIADAESDNRDISGLRAAPRYRPDESGLCAGAPADLFGQVVWVDAEGLWLAPHADAVDQAPRRLDTWGPGEVPRSPVVAHRLDAQPELFVAVSGPDGCDLRMYDRSGAPNGHLHAAARDCTSPAIARRVVMWPVGDLIDEGDAGEALPAGRLLFFHAATLQTIGRLDLPAHPVAPPIVLGHQTADGGGSHWLVATDDGVVAVRDYYDHARLEDDDPIDPNVSAPPIIAGTWSATDGQPSALLVLDPYALVMLRARDDDGLGTRVQVLDVSPTRTEAVTIGAHGPPLDLPAPSRAHPVTIGGCASVAGGGSHWFCPPDAAGAIVAAGDGWIGGWSVPDGAPLFHDVAALSWTGLAVGQSGWVAGGGSHWLPGPDDSWVVTAFDPSGASDSDATGMKSMRPIASGALATCIPSPLWDTDGSVAVPVVTSAAREVVRAPMPLVPGHLGPAMGQSRPLGDNRNGGLGTAQLGVCSDGWAREVSALRLFGDRVDGVVRADELVVFGSNAAGGFVRWVESPSDLDGPRASVPSASALEHVLPLANRRAVAAWLDQDVPGTFDIAMLIPNLPPLWQYAIASDVEGLTRVVDLGVSWVVGGRGPSGDHVVRVESGGVGDDVVFPPDDGAAGLVDVVGTGGLEVILVANSNGTLALRRVSGKLLELDRAVYAPTDTTITAVSTSYDNGVTRALVLATPKAGGPPQPRLLRFDAALELVDDRPIGVVGPMVTAPGGGGAIATADGLVMVGAGGEIGVTRPYPIGATRLPEPLALDPNGSWLVGLDAASDEPMALIVRADALGFASCEASGRCFTVEIDACADATPCVMSACAPADGGCASESAPICE